MAEQTETSTEAVVDEASAETQGQETDWKAQARKWESRAKANSEAADKLAAIEDANRSESERFAAQLAQAQQTAATSATEAARLRVALTKGLPPELATRLQGDDEEQMSADADTLLSLIPQQRPADKLARRPGESANGAAGSSGTTTTNAARSPMDALIRQAIANR